MNPSILTKKEIINKSTRYNTPYGDVYINCSSKNAGIALSGGLDSAVILYLLAKTLHDNNSKATIYPFTARRGNPTDFSEYDRVDIYPYVDKIISYVKEKFPTVTIAEPLKKDADYWWLTEHVNGRNVGSYTETLTNLARYMAWRFSGSHEVDKQQPQHGELLYVEYTGITKNPPKDSLPQSDESHRDVNHPNSLKKSSATIVTVDPQNPFVLYFEPFRNSDKRITMWLAEEYNILKDLLPITRSCEGGPTETENFTKECMECWWCLERHWALSQYKGNL